MRDKVSEKVSKKSMICKPAPCNKKVLRSIEQFYLTKNKVF